MDTPETQTYTVERKVVRYEVVEVEASSPEDAKEQANNFMEDEKKRSCTDHSLPDEAAIVDVRDERREQLIEDLERVNEAYGERAEYLHEQGQHDEALDVGQTAEAHGLAAKALREGASFEHVNDRWEGILDAI